MKKVKIGFIGCGTISHIYLKNCTEVFDNLDVVAVADMVPEMAKKQAEKFNIPKACSVDELLADPEIEIVVNLTSPAAHTDVNVKILEAGKHVYAEKPLALAMEDAERVIALAESKNLRIGSAPDTFLGAQLQTARKVIDDGWIGTVYGANGMILSGSAWDGMHPNLPALLDYGWDPLFDMAPYWITAFIHLLGPASRVAGSVNKVREEFLVNNPKSPYYGKTIPVKPPMNVTALIDFTNGTTAHLFAAKEGFGYTPRLEVYGTEGILSIQDPNMFGGSVCVRFTNGEEKEFPYSHGYAENSRGVGVAEMAAAMQSGRKHRANGELAKHVFDISFAILNSSRLGHYIALESTCERPAPLPLGMKFNQFD